MNLQVGDHVRFLNEVGEGVIRSIDKQIATVEIEDGFEIPMLVAELVKVYTKTSAPLAASATGKTSPASPALTKAPVKIERALANSIAGEESVYLAYVPEDESKLLTSPLQVFIVNNTSYQVVYSYAIGMNNSDTGVAVGYIYPNTEKLLQTVNRGEVERWGSVLVQLLFHSRTPFQAQAPVQQRLAIKSSFFTSIDKLKKLGGINKHAFLMTVVGLNAREKVEKKELFSLVEKYKTESVQNPGKSVASVKSERYINSVDNFFKNLTNEIEVDLHIEELTDYFTGMSNGEIVEFQLEYFRKCMDKAMASHVQKIVFIHGVGNGTLKRELRHELKHYKGIRVEDGSYNKYGSGATQVVFGK